LILPNRRFIPPSTARANAPTAVVSLRAAAHPKFALNPPKNVRSTPFQLLRQPQTISLPSPLATLRCKMALPKEVIHTQNRISQL